MEGPGGRHQSTVHLMDRSDKKMRHHVREIECRVSGRDLIRTADGIMVFDRTEPSSADVHGAGPARRAHLPRRYRAGGSPGGDEHVPPPGMFRAARLALPAPLRRSQRAQNPLSRCESSRFFPPPSKGPIRCRLPIIVTEGCRIRRSSPLAVLLAPGICIHQGRATPQPGYRARHHGRGS